MNKAVLEHGCPASLPAYSHAAIWSPNHPHDSVCCGAGRGGWVATRNFEVDSGAYFISLLWNYYRTPGLYAPERLLNETVVHDAVAAMINTWRIEQRHEEQSPYRWVASMGSWLAAGGRSVGSCGRRPCCPLQHLTPPGLAPRPFARRYSELPRNGLGPPSGYTGMIWGGYRPSDDPQVGTASGARPCA